MVESRTLTQKYCLRGQTFTVLERNTHTNTQTISLPFLTRNIADVLFLGLSVPRRIPRIYPKAKEAPLRRRWIFLSEWTTVTHSMRRECSVCLVVWGWLCRAVKQTPAYIMSLLMLASHSTFISIFIMDSTTYFCLITVIERYIHILLAYLYIPIHLQICLKYVFSRKTRANTELN